MVTKKQTDWQRKCPKLAIETQGIKDLRSLVGDHDLDHFFSWLWTDHDHGGKWSWSFQFSLRSITIIWSYSYIYTPMPCDVCGQVPKAGSCRSRKLSSIKLSQYLDGWPAWESIVCFSSPLASVFIYIFFLDNFWYGGHPFTPEIITESKNYKNYFSIES